MPQTVWTGQLSFGLVSIPVRLYSATSPKKVRFHQYDSQTGRRIRYRRVAAGPALEEPPPPSAPDAPPEPQAAPEPEPQAVPGPEAEAPAAPDEAGAVPDRRLPPAAAGVERSGARRDEQEVPWEEIVKGYEIEPGRVVTVTPEELVSVAPERSRVLEVEQFVDLHDVDPVHFEKSYCVVPQPGAGAERPYWLLYRAMEAAQKVAVGRFVMRTREYLAAVRPAEHVLMLETLFYADEVRDPKAFWIPPVEEPPERELRIAQQLIEALAGPWDPTRLRDEHRERLLELLRTKVGEMGTLPEPAEEEPPPAIDLMEALKASVEAATRARAEQRRQTG
ncbi:MAG TPA: Ku protein [Actinomycetota bacterium]|nr:Ku protein [Actinomycetota bacterium]